MPDRKGTQLLLEQLGEPLIATTLIPPGETEALHDADAILERFPHELDMADISSRFLGISSTPWGVLRSSDAPRDFSSRARW